MTQPNKFSKAQERAIKAVGKEIEQARLALRLSVREAAKRTNAPGGPIGEFTWRRVERGFIQQGGYEIVHRAKATTLMAIAEVVELDGAALCKKVGLEPPPPARRPQTRRETAASIEHRMEELARAMTDLTEEVRRMRQ